MNVVNSIIMSYFNLKYFYYINCYIFVTPIHLDSAFTERVLGLPTENYKGYVEADATQRAKYIPSKSLFILHGLADLTVPYQHGIALARALTEAGILYRYQVTQNYNILCHTFNYIIIK